MKNKCILSLTILLIMCLSLANMLYGGLGVVAVSNVVKVCSFSCMCLFFIIKYIMIYGFTLDIFKEKPVTFRIIRKGDNFTAYANGRVVSRFNSKDIGIISVAHSNGVFLDNICF